jgi:hypothetical protein
MPSCSDPRRHPFLTSLAAGTNSLGTAASRVSYSYFDEGTGGSTSDYYNWGRSGATGTLTIASDGKSGSFDGHLPYSGDDRNSHPANAYTAINVKGSWAC